MQTISSIRLGVALVIAASASASAQPVTSPASCAVTIARAPEDVRVAVEAWVRAEPRCSTALEVRIIPTDGGFYILAQDERGRIRERIVPDAQSAGVLIASWVADDSMYAPLPTATPGRDVSPPSPIGDESLMPPGSAAAPAHAPPAARVSKWIGLGILLEPSNNDGGGLRADADVSTHEHYSLGVAISTSAHTMTAYSPYGDGQLTTRDIKLMATAAHIWQTGRWFVRGAAGLGAVHTSAFAVISSTYAPYSFVQASGWFPTAELVGNAGVELGKDWAFSIGPAITMYSQQFNAEMTDPPYTQQPSGPIAVSRRSLELLILTGLKYRL